ncbi:hypothetical protein MBCUT_02300 [Methanobrevibacter cuticularis]|uniref:Uncharacterized protein n=1 Tax=Methanobrevibacter cuticularis TaxID=47311 RepID=A0A166F6I3_9EURY|nr:HVO_0476 family zinc finger protein [Methanobrevibacter cuticularis]KZX17364.1 hypothetical protein MBCUT_02300 [Methanobrevibacter cuticularis]
MNCPMCGCDSTETLKSKTVPSKTKEVNELLLKCKNCDFVFKDSIIANKPVSYRLIISEHEKSKKTFIDLYSDEKLSKDNILLSDLGQVEIKSLELKDGKRVDSAIAKDVSTIWASSMEIPARVGISVDFSGDVDSYKVDVDRDSKFAVDDILKVDDKIIRIYAIKTLERILKKGFAKSSVIKRVYGNPVNLKNYDYDLTANIVYKKITAYKK